MALLGLSSTDKIQKSHRNWVEESLRTATSRSESKWTESIAVGSAGFVERVKREFGVRAKGRKITESDDGFQLKERRLAYSCNSIGKNERLSLQNLHFWNLYRGNQDG